jgi:hypothetical protein
MKPLDQTVRDAFLAEARKSGAVRPCQAGASLPSQV